MPVPKFDDLFNPLLEAIRNLGGSASIAEQEDAVASILQLSEKEISQIHKGNRTKLSYRLAWARTYLKQYGLLENSTRGVWALTPMGTKTPLVDKAEVVRVVRATDRESQIEVAGDTEAPIPQDRIGWQDELLDTLRQMPPAAFEKLCQRLLRESGFIHVEVTGRSGDGGIDGKGVVKIGGLLSFHVIFQCKRYTGSVSAPVVRDFRGAMVGRADKGLLITTGAFTRDARQEAQRDGAPPIDLIDGEMLTEKLKDLRLGVDVSEKVIEEVSIRKTWFESL